MPLRMFSFARASGGQRLLQQRLHRTLLAVAVILLLAFGALAARAHAAPPVQAGGPGETLFQAKCTACHTIGKGKLVGPDLQDVTVRRDVQWLKRFIADPNQLFAANDPTAVQLLAENNNVKMPALGLTAAEVDALVTFLDGARSASGGGGTGSSAAAPALAPQPAAIAGDPVAGQLVFTGERSLANGGPACIACHSVSTLGGLGGGALGPDLTHAAQRYPGAALPSVLGTIAFPTMVGPFTNRALTPPEQADLVAFLAQADQVAPPTPAFAAGAWTQRTGWVLGLGAAGLLALTVLLAFFWPRQRRSVSARLRARARVQGS